jgi:hypothetical protein
LLHVDKLIPEVIQHYPDEPVNAMTYLMEKYDLEPMAATHLVSSIWSTLHMQYPLNLQTFLVNPFSIFKN